MTGAIADALVPLPGPAMLWMELARHVGVIEPDPSGQRLLAAPPGFWIDNAVHLPQMIATGWLALRNWHELGGTRRPSRDRREPGGALSPARPLVLAGHARRRRNGSPWTIWPATSRIGIPAWDRLHLDDPAGRRAGARDPIRRRAAHRRSGRSGSGSDPSPHGLNLLESILLGAAYPLGLVRAAEEEGSGRRVVQLTSLGRYALAAGPTPPPRPTFDQFLFVQPNFEMIAYRQGLTPRLVGRLSRFAWWSQIGAALELKLTRTSIELGLDGRPDARVDDRDAGRHTQRPLPAGVVDAVRTWATRRERMTYYAAATLIEFGSSAERDQALETWPRR